MDPEAEPEKMAALKKAYADVILNTAKESAARILASERKAQRCEQALFSAKEEALGMLLRLKGLMDSKMKEAEMTSLGQVKRIQELEVQLSEAECTIGSLKEELEQANTELKKMKNGFVEPLNERKENGRTPSGNGKCQESQLSSDSHLCPRNGPASMSTSNIRGTSSGQKNKDDGCRLARTVTHTESLRHLPTEKDCSSNPDLASIIMRSKEPELYRNGCTQRIRAFDNNVLTANMPNAQNNGQKSDVINESVVSDNNKLERPHTVDSAKTDKKVTQKATNSSGYEGHIQPSNNCGVGHSVKFFRRLSPRKPRTRCVYLKPMDGGNSQNRDAKFHEPSDFEDAESVSAAVLATKSIGEEPPQKLLKLHSAPISTITADNRTPSLSNSLSSGFSVLFPCNNRNVTEQIATTQNGTNSQNEISHSSAYIIENNDHGSSINDMNLMRSTKMEDGVPVTETKQNGEAKTLQIDDSKLTPADQNKPVNLDPSDVKYVRSNPEDVKPVESHEASPQVGKDKFLKYTFQRTRKRGSSSGKSESIVPEKVTGKRKSGEKQKGLQEPSKPAVTTDLPREDRKLMLVARQLISLSERRW